MPKPRACGVDTAGLDAGKGWIVIASEPPDLAFRSQPEGVRGGGPGRRAGDGGRRWVLSGNLWVERHKAGRPILPSVPAISRTLRYEDTEEEGVAEAYNVDLGELAISMGADEDTDQGDDVTLLMIARGQIG